MSSMNAILGDPDRLERLVKDMIADYETRCADKPDLLQKAMITCSDRMIAYKLYKIIDHLLPKIIANLYHKTVKLPDIIIK